MNKKLILKELSRYKIDTFADIVYRNALLRGDAEVFIANEERITFRRFNERVNSLVHGLHSLGLAKGDGIGVLSWNCLECTDASGAAMKGGFIVSPFNPRMRTAELEYIINYSDVKALFVGPELVEEAERLRPRLPQVRHYISLEGEAAGMRSLRGMLDDFPVDEPGVDVGEDDLFIIFYTSGTTGVPRGAVYTHARKIRDARNKALQMGLNPNCKHVMILPLFHVGGWSHFWAFFYAGASNVIMPKGSYNPLETLRTIQDEKATDIHIVPTHLVGMLSAPDIGRYDLSSLQRMWYAASPMPTELLRKGIATFGEIFAQGYGQSESGPDIAILTKEAHKVLEKSPEEQKILASAGQPCLGVHVRVVDDDENDVEPGAVGEIVVRQQIDNGRILENARRNRENDRRWLAAHRRYGTLRRERLHLHRRPEEGPDHHGRGECLSERGRRGALPPSLGAGSDSRRGSRRKMGRAGPCGCCAQGRREGFRGRHNRFLQKAPRRIQGAEVCGIRRSPAEKPPGENPEKGDPGKVLAREGEEGIKG